MPKQGVQKSLVSGCLHVLENTMLDFDAQAFTKLVFLAQVLSVNSQAADRF
jgi:hypothetical protein